MLFGFCSTACDCLCVSFEVYFVFDDHLNLNSTGVKKVVVVHAATPELDVK